MPYTHVDIDNWKVSADMPRASKSFATLWHDDMMGPDCAHHVSGTIVM